MDVRGGIEHGERGLGGGAGIGGRGEGELPSLLRQSNFPCVDPTEQQHRKQEA